MLYKTILPVTFLLFFVVSCTKEKDLSFHIYDKEGYIAADGKFMEDQFFDTIFVYKKKDNEPYNDYFDTLIIIDSTTANFYYGTEIVLEKNTHKIFSKGTYRFEKNKDPKESFSSKLYIGLFTKYTRDGLIYSQDYYKIKGDSSYKKSMIPANE